MGWEVVNGKNDYYMHLLLSFLNPLWTSSRLDEVISFDFFVRFFLGRKYNNRVEGSSVRCDKCHAPFCHLE